MITETKIPSQLSSQPCGRGRPKLGVYRLQCTIPREVLDQLVSEETVSGQYRTQIARQVLTEWAASKTSSKSAVTQRH
jgi:hypothetical protein